MKRIIAASALLALTACTSTVQNADLENKVAALEKRVSELERKAINRPALYRKYFNARMAEDRKTYPGDFSKIENEYQTANQNADPEKQKEELNALIKKYPKANRSGCAMLYIGQKTKGKEQEEYLLKAINEYGNCWYGNGVQVGAYARLWLAENYKKAGKKTEADKLFAELRKDYPDAIDHRGRLLSEQIPELN